MYQKKTNDKRKNSKLISKPKLKKNIFRNSKSKVELRTKVNNLIKKEDKNSLANTDINSNLTLLENKTISENINYENSIHNNFLHIEQNTKLNSISGTKKTKRKIIPLNLADKFKNPKLVLSNYNNSKKNSNLSLVNYMNNKTSINKNFKNLNELKSDLKERKDTKFNILRGNLKDKNLLDKKMNKGKQDEINFSIKLYNQPSNNTNNINNSSKVNESEKNLAKNKSYDFLKKVSLNKHEEKINHNQNVSGQNTEKCHYIKVNKKVINQENTYNTNINTNKDKKNIENINNEKKNENLKIKNENSCKNTNKLIKDKINTRNAIKVITLNYKNNINDLNNNAKLDEIVLKKIEKVKKSNNNNLYYNKSDLIKKKTKNIIIDKNKLENNIFLDKTYQNRFKNNQKNSKNPQNDIFTNDKQKEYNTFIIKKKNNYLTNMIINSHNKRSSKKNTKDWVYRLYNKEIKKQKIKNKLILLLRKSILNDRNDSNSKKKMEKSKTVNHFKKFKYPVNEGYNIDDNFNIINLFLSDDKKKKKEKNQNKRKKMKRCQSFHAYRKKQRKYSFDNNIEEDPKIAKLVDDKIYLKNQRSYKKLRYMYYNEELINEEDEEKEKEDDEDKYN